MFVIENSATDSPIARLEHNTRTGIVTFFDRVGKVVGEKQLTDAERAWLTPDPLAEKYYSFSPYAFCLNNPINIIDPFGMDNYYINGNGNIRIEFNDDKFNQYNYLTTNSKGAEVNNFIGQFDKNDKGMIQLSNFAFDNGNISFAYNVKSGNDNYISGNAMASFLGAMASTGFNDVTVIGGSLADGSTPSTSKSHQRGEAMDLRYLRTDMSGGRLDIRQNAQALDVARQNQFNNALYTYGFTNQLSGSYTQPGGSPMMLDRTKPAKGHTDHLHIGGKYAGVHTFNPYIYVNGGVIPQIIVNGKR